jgi:hypothetical protein
MDVKSTMHYTHVLNVAVDRSAVRLTGCTKLSQTRAARLTGPTSRPKTGRASYRTRQKSLQSKRLPPRCGTGPCALG